jgi:ribosomal protein S27E
MIITCPKCNTQHDVTGRPAGDKLTCSCGNVLAVPAGGGAPAKAKSSTSASTVVLIVLAVLAVPCVIGILAAIAIPSFIRYQERAKAAEARTNLRMLCTDEVSYHAEHDEWLAAGPAPRPIPGRQPVAFPRDPNFEKLGFEPGRVRYQYEVLVDGDPRGANTPVRCVARGDLKGTGRPSLLEVRIGEDGAPGPVRAEHETE